MKERLEYLFLQYLESTASEKELEEFLSYVKEARNDQALREMIRTVYKAIREADPGLISYIDEAGNLVLNDPAALLDGGEPAMAAAGRPGKYRGRAILTLSVVVILLCLAAWWIPRAKAHGKRDLVSVRSLTKKFTERAEYKFLLLPDSTQVWLNTNSSLEFPDEFSDKKREVYLTGEAYFDVRHAEEIPFIIHTGKISTTVLGTAFNIKAYPYQREVLVSVSKGKVKVSRDDKTVAILQKGQQVKISNADTAVRQKNIDTAVIAFWQKGTIAFDDETIGDIVQNLEQVYNVSINVCDDSLLNTRITTSFNRNIGVDQALKIIGKLTDQKLVIRDGKYSMENN